MISLQRQRDRIALVCAIAVPIAVAAILTTVRGTFANTAAALVLVGVVVAVAANGNRVAGALSAAVAALSFDFFLTVPYDRLAISHRSDLETAITLFVVGISVSELAARGRHHRDVATEQSDHVVLLHEFSELVAAGEPVEEIIDQACHELEALLYLRNCRFEAGVPAERVNVLDHRGNVELGQLRWGVHQLGLPGKRVDLLVESRGVPAGRFVLTPTPGWPVSRARRLVAVALADQVGAALTRRLRSA